MRPLPQGLDILAFEGAHVVLLVALDLVADGEMSHAVATQVERVEVAGGVFGGGEGGDPAYGFKALSGKAGRAAD